jgi:hypothetical protein
VTGIYFEAQNVFESGHAYLRLTGTFNSLETQTYADPEGTDNLVASDTLVLSQSTPEPASLTLLASAFAVGGFGLVRRRRAVTAK